MKFNRTRFDLNLLNVLDILETERSVQDAAARLHVTPSAVSHALSRLRSNFDDPLFTRSRHGLVATQRCKTVLRNIRPLLRSVAQSLDPDYISERERFEPRTDKRSVTIAMPGAVEVSLLPSLATRLRELAPGWSLEVVGFQRRSYEADLLSGDVQLVFSVGGHTPTVDGVSTTALWTDQIVAVQGPNGIIAAATVSLEECLGLPQIYPVPWPRTQNFLDISLAREGRQRAIATSLPSYAGVGELLSRTDLICLMPDRTALAVQRVHPHLRIVELARAIRTSLSLEISEQFANSPAGFWLKQVVLSVSRIIPAKSQRS